MNQAFGWIGEIFQAMLRVIPWLVIVPATHGGVAFSRGRHIKEWHPGVHLYWPMVTTYQLIMIVRQTQRIHSKIVMTKDEKTVLVGALVTYYVDDVVSAVAKIADLASDVIERSQGELLAAVSETTLAAIQADRPSFNVHLTERAQEVLNGYGVHVLQVKLTEFAPCRALALSGNIAVGQYSLWTGF